MKKAVLLAIVILLSAAGTLQAEDGRLGVTVNVTYLSSYIWRGTDVYSQNHSAIQPGIDVDLYGTGFGVTVLSSRANGSGFENFEELRTGLYYYNTAFEDQVYATAYRLGWVYYNYPDNPAKAFDQQEAFLSLSWPKICPAGLVPSYTVACAWPAKRNSTNASDFGGWVHVLGLGYDMAAPGLAPDPAGQIFHLYAMVVYNDGIGPPGETVDHDWSHAVFGVSTDFELTQNLTFTPGVHYQASMDDSINNEDETWVSLSMKYKF